MNRRIPAVVPVLVAAALGLAACTSAADTPASPSSSTAPSTAASASGSAAASSFGESWESIACDALGLAPEFNDVTDCGYVTVPENREAGGDATIRLAVARVRSLGPDAGLPILFGEGGPGGNGFLNATLGNIAIQTPYLQNHDYVFFSQRGTSKAEPSLQCPDYNAVMLSAAAAGKSIEERRADQRAAFQACVDGFRDQGVDFSAYNTNENADDVADIAKALGYDQVIYQGASYGTWLGQVVAKRHPDLLAGLILDGVAPLTADAWSDISDFAAMRKVGPPARQTRPATRPTLTRREFDRGHRRPRREPPTVDIALPTAAPRPSRSTEPSPWRPCTGRWSGARARRTSPPSSTG